MNEKITMTDIINYCKQYGFIYPGSEIYGGMSNTFDYGPLGTRLKNSIKDAWRIKFIQTRENAYELDSGILMHPKVWEASGHVGSFSDPLIDCKHCKSRYRADNLISEYDSSVAVDSMTDQELLNYINTNKVPCLKCGKSDYTDIREFNLMFETNRGVTKDSNTTIYLRPENAQGEYINFLNVQRSMRAKIPFSIGQIGKVFRNEITPGNFTFRTIEFEQMEYQTFCHEDNARETYCFYKNYGLKFYTDLGIKLEHLRFHDHEKLAFYAKDACDIEFLFPFGWGEINGTHHRSDYDLKQHEKYTGTSMAVIDNETNQKFVPNVIESTYGVDRTFLAVLCDAYKREIINENDTREVLSISPFLAPYKLAILPLIKKNHADFAKMLYQKYNKYFMCTYDESASIGKRYRRQDAIGTPFCITIDENTLKDNVVTIRFRDTMEQQNIMIDEVVSFVLDNIKL